MAEADGEAPLEAAVEEAEAEAGRGTLASNRFVRKDARASRAVGRGVVGRGVVGRGGGAAIAGDRGGRGGGDDECGRSAASVPRSTVTWLRTASSVASRRTSAPPPPERPAQRASEEEEEEERLRREYEARIRALW